MKSRFPGLLAIGVLLALTLAFTYPLVLRMGSVVNDPGDPLLNAWILDHNVRRILAGEWSELFQTNLFYPQPRTLAYSEILIPQSLLAILPRVLTGNPIFAYNFVLLASLWLSAVGGYVLAHRLTKDRLAGLVGGIGFGLSPFMLGHPAHVQVMFGGGLPLAFYFALRFFESHRLRDAAALGLVCGVQILGNCYYAVYLAFFLGLTVLYHLVSSGDLRRPGVWAKLAVTLGITAGMVAPFFRYYFEFRREMAFAREIDLQATPIGWLSAPSMNLFLGDLAKLANGENHLYPGAVLLALALLGWVLLRRARSPQVAPARREWSVSIRPVALVGWLVVLLAGAVIWVSLVGPIRWEIRMSTAKRGVFALLLLVLGWAAFDRTVRRRWFVSLTSVSAWQAWFGGVFVIAALAGFGEPGFYEVLRAYVPGFSALRAVLRIHVFVMLVLAMLAAIGVRQIGQRVGPKSARIVGLLGVALVGVEFASWQRHSAAVEPLDQIPRAYHWLAEQEGDTPVLEFPIDGYYRPGCRQLYYSCLHHKPLVNGFSGYIPRMYIELVMRWQRGEVASVLDDARELGVRYLIVRTEDVRGETGGEKRLAKLERHLAERVAAGRLRHVMNEEGHGVWEMLGTEPLPREYPELPGRLSRAGWRVEASPQTPAAGVVLDGDPETRWHAPEDRVGAWLQVDLGGEQAVRGVELDLGPYARDFPRACVVRVSNDGTSWRAAGEFRAQRMPILSFLRAGRLVVEIPLEPTRARYVRIENTEASPEFYWSVGELYVNSG